MTRWADNARVVNLPPRRPHFLPTRLDSNQSIKITNTRATLQLNQLISASDHRLTSQVVLKNGKK
ncbi:unnamed protein product [Acanthoscelides obtectus]|uniref:Uncharacterized protein n=1 Tax=Acanthoscelides obtectus TaxID=200917 RepID=A0A9P0L7W1_ACAOB|nr:unnamed protein product [Acanthoscelides obtectus]CAK1669090.1 hypothetical protein AOBTE_LOCUS26792 [Acanthoscelides obtectus]